LLEDEELYTSAAARHRSGRQLFCTCNMMMMMMTLLLILCFF